MTEALVLAERYSAKIPAAEVLQLGTLALAESTPQEEESVPFLARWAVEGVSPVGSTDMAVA